MLPYFNEFYGNASSSHLLGKTSKLAIDEARKNVSKLINANENEIIFTSGATESINLALKGYVEENFEKGNHIITCKTEHKAVLNTCEYLETKGIEVTYLDVDSTGLINLKDLENSITTNTALIAIMYANNETGVVQDIKSIGNISKKHNLTFFCDATQAIGKVKIDVNHLNIDMLCMSAHKLNGPKGIGFLYKKNGINLTPLLHGGAQENYTRGGTYNTPLIVGLGKTCEITKNKIKENNYHYQTLFQTVVNFINNIDNISLIGNKDNRLYNIINLRIKGIDASVFAESSNVFMVSNGSACTSRIIEGSHVLKAMGFTDMECNQCLRISFDLETSIDHIIQFFEILNKIKC